VTAVLVVAFGRLGDIWGRVRMYNAGFAIFTIGSLVLAATPFTGGAGAIWIIAMRFVQAIGGALLFANSQAILTDAFPAEQRGLAFGINGVSFLAGQFIGSWLGGILAAINWRLVFFVSVPVGIVGTIWGVPAPRGTRHRHSRPDRLAGKRDLRRRPDCSPHRDHLRHPAVRRPGDGLDQPVRHRMIVGGGLLLGLFVWIERRVAQPLFDLDLFGIRAFGAGNLAGFLSALGRGGLSFVLVIWLQGIWLPLHGYDYADTPLWAGIYMLPLTVGSLVFGPLSGYLSDRFGARPFATAACSWRLARSSASSCCR